jgi:hypothetical protein
MSDLLTPEQLAAIEARAAKQALAELRKEAIDKCHGDFGAPDLNPEYQVSLSLLVREVYAILNSEQYIDDLLAHAREQAATIAALEAKLTEALALVEAGYAEGHQDGQRYMAENYKPHAVTDDYTISDTRAAVERLKGDAV